MAKPLVSNAADEDQVKNAGRNEKVGRDREISDAALVLSSVQGRRFVWRYLEFCGVFKTSFTGNSQTFFNEGQRNIGLKLLEDVMESSPDSYLQMMKESKGDHNG